MRFDFMYSTDIETVNILLKRKGTVNINEIVSGFEELPTGNICDSNGLIGAMDPSIQALSRKMAVVGQALTVDAPPHDNLTIHAAVQQAKPGDVLVINCNGCYDAGIFGEMMAVCCRAHGIAGIVIDGACRDKNELIDMNFPTFVHNTSPNGTTKEKMGSINQPIVCGGKEVNPGDIIVGDADGVVVIAAQKAEEVLIASLKKHQFEERILPQLQSGVTIAELMKLSFSKAQQK